MSIALHEPTSITSTLRPGIDLVTVSESLWRVRGRDGRIHGHVERVNTAAGDTFVAKRFSPARAAFLPLGQFWNVQDAVDCLL